MPWASKIKLQKNDTEKSDFILALKDNQSALFQNLKSIVALATKGENKFKKMLDLCKVEIN